MGKKSKAPVGANLSTSQKAELKSAILAEYPNLKQFEKEVDILISGYDKDKKYPEKLMESIEKRSKDEQDEPEDTGVMKNLGPDDPEYHETLKRMNDAQEKFMEEQRKAIEEEDKKQKEKEQENQKVKNVTIISQ